LKPFLKWAGNKYCIIERIQALLPDGKRLIEPFAGSAAVFLNTEYDKYLIAEINPDLVTLYETLQQQGDDFIHFCQQYFQLERNTKQQYYAFRKEFNATEDPKVKALFIYLNKHGYNGLCRYNASGEFNVPFGYRKICSLPVAEMQHFYEKAKSARFVCRDFRKVMQSAKKGDVVYCDPPYVPLTKTANFTKYSSHAFDEKEQIILAEQAEHLAARGIPVLISNHDTDFVRELYKKAEIISFPVYRRISCKPETRTNAKEILALLR